MSDEKKGSNSFLVIPLIMVCALYIYAASGRNGYNGYSGHPPDDPNGILHLKEIAESKGMQWVVKDTGPDEFGEEFCASAWRVGKYGIDEDWINECAHDANGNYAAGRLASELKRRKDEAVAGSQTKLTPKTK